MNVHSIHHVSSVPTPQSWLQIVVAKQLYFHAVAQHRLGKVAQADKSFGTAVARMGKAVALLQEAEKRGEGAFKGYVSTFRGYIYSVCACLQGLCGQL